MFPATLFDYNGVLVDDEAVHLEAFREVLEPLGLEVSDVAYWETYIGFDDYGAFEAIYADAGRTVTREQLTELVDLKKPAYLRRARHGLRAFPGARELVRRLAARGPVLVVSGALRSEIELGLERLAIEDAIEHVVAAEDCRSSKPDPEGYLLAVRHLASALDPRDAARAVVVEDSVAGIQAAKAARLACVAVTHSYPRQRLEEAGADAVVDSLAAITDPLLEALYARLYPS